MRNRLAAQPPWRQILIVSLAVSALVVAAVLAFAWPAARVAPRDLPVGIVGTGAASERAVQTLDRGAPGGYDFHLYPDESAARTAIRHRDVYGAFGVTSHRVTVLTASAASPAVAQLLDTAGAELAGHAAVAERTLDVVATSADDPRGLVLSSAVLPLTIVGIVMAAFAALLLGARPVWCQLATLCVVSATAGLGAYLIAQPFLGALPQEHLATWGALALTMLAVGAAVAGLVSLLGTGGLLLGAAVMILVGNPFSGAGTAPQLLPGAVDHIGQWLPPGAGANLLRSAAYFHGNGATGHLTVLVLWAAGGLAAVLVGRRWRMATRPVRHGAHEEVPAAGLAAVIHAAG